MALVDFGGGGFLFPNWVSYVPLTPTSGIPAFTSTITDAAGEMCAFIGHIWFPEGPGTSKLVSSAGANIQFRTGAVTWAGAGTTIRVGIQDVSTTLGPIVQPDEDWTGEPYGTLVQGTDALSANTWTTVNISTGSRTVTHGDLIAIVMDMTVRNGADSVAFTGLQMTSQQHRPVVSAKTSGTWAAPAQLLAPNFVLRCDDGTLASFLGASPASVVTVRTIGTGSNPDEYGNLINIPFDCRASGLWANVDPDNEFELKLYSSATGTPTTEQTVTIDPNQVLVNSGRTIQVACGAESLDAGSAYAVTVRPTGAGTVAVYEIEVADANHLKFWPGGTNVYKCTREGDTGVLTPTTTARILCGIMIDQVDDGAGGTTTATIQDTIIGTKVGLG